MTPEVALALSIAVGASAFVGGFVGGSFTTYWDQRKERQPVTRLRFQVIADDGERTEVLADELVSFDDAEAAATRHGEMARDTIDSGRAVWLVVSDPDEGDRIITKARAVPEDYWGA